MKDHIEIGNLTKHDAFRLDISQGSILCLNYVYSKSIIRDQITNLNMILYVVVSLYRFVKTGNSLQFAAEFRNGQLTAEKGRTKLSQYYNTRLLTGNNS